MEIKDLQEQLGAAKLREDALKSAVEERDAQIETLEAQATNADPSVTTATPNLTIPEQTAMVNGKAYALVVAAFWHAGKYHISTEAIADIALMTALVVEKSGIIKEI